MDAGAWWVTGSQTVGHYLVTKQQETFSWSELSQPLGTWSQGAWTSGSSQFRGTESRKHTWDFKDLLLKIVTCLCNVDINYILKWYFRYLFCVCVCVGGDSVPQGLQEPWGGMEPSLPCHWKRGPLTTDDLRISEVSWVKEHIKLNFTHLFLFFFLICLRIFAFTCRREFPDCSVVRPQRFQCGSPGSILPWRTGIPKVT